MTEKSDKKQPKGGRFRPGVSGNPAGKPKGARNKVLLALDQVGADSASEVLNAAVQAAKNGDMRAAELILSRIWPARKGRPVMLQLPAMKVAADLASAIGAVVSATASGTITPDEGQAITGILEAQRKAIETVELEDRLRAIEERLHEQER